MAQEMTMTLIPMRKPVKDQSWIHVPDDEELVGTKASNPRTSSCRRDFSV